MNILKGRQLLQDMKEEFSPQLFLETMKINNIPITIHWAPEATVEASCYTHIVRALKWDPDTTLVYYTAFSEWTDDSEYNKQNTDWDQLWAGADNIFCLLIQNMTSERLINLLDKTSKMKAFL